MATATECYGGKFFELIPNRIGATKYCDIFNKLYSRATFYSHINQIYTPLHFIKTFK